LGGCIIMRLNVTNILGSGNNTAITFGSDSAGTSVLAFPNTPCFSAQDMSTTKTGSSAARILLYTFTNSNIGNHYNSATGKFTAPISGIYFFSYHMATQAQTSFRNFSGLLRNGLTYIESTQEQNTGSGNADRILAISCLMYLNANDFVECAATAQTLADAGYNSFSGYYIGA
jgi:hypothetical protein